MKNAFGGLMSRLEDTAEERIFKLEDMSLDSSKTEKQREKRPKKKVDYPRTVRQL